MSMIAALASPRLVMLLCCFVTRVVPLEIHVDNGAQTPSPADSCAEDDSTVSTLWNDVFDCEVHFAKPRPIHNESTWLLMRGVYHGIVGPLESTITHPVSYDHGMEVSYQVRHTEKGRGIFADQDIPEGTLVWRGAAQSARFSTGKQYRQFLYSIPPDLACDVLQWAYVVSSDEDRPRESGRIGVDLDEGSYLNAGSDAEPENVDCLDQCSTNMEMYSIRPIEKGEEILCNYQGFANEDGWTWFGLHHYDSEDDDDEDEYEDDDTEVEDVI